MEEANTISVLTGFDFLSTLFSILRSNKKTVISINSLFEFINSKRNEYEDLFLDIDINNNGDFVHSNDLEEGLSMLQIIGAIGKVNPRYEKVMIKLHYDSAQEIIKQCSEDYKPSIEKFAEEFISHI